MKTLLIAFAFIIAASTSFSQFTFERISDPLVVGDSSGGHYEIKSIALLKVQTGSESIRIIRTINNLTPSWQNCGTSICNFELCFNISVDSVTATYSSASSDDSIWVYFYLFDTTANFQYQTGAGHVRLRAELVSNPSFFIEQDFRACTPNYIGIQQITSVVKEFSLGQNYPNPFNPTTNIRFSIPKSEHVSLRVYDILGREVKALVNQNLTPGEYQVDFDATGLSSGMYYYSLRSGDFVDVKKMVLVK